MSASVAHGAGPAGAGGGEAVLGLIVPPHPHPLLVPEQNAGWGRLRTAFDEARQAIEASGADLILLYSTTWPSVIGHQIQADPTPEWVHVDELFHDLGSIPYRFSIDAPFAHAYHDAARARGLSTRTVAYHGFPIDTGSVVALKLLNPDNRIPACIVSSNVYADRAETIVLAKAAMDAAVAQGKRVAAVAVTSLSNRMFSSFIDPSEDRIHSQKDDEWNRKMLEFLADGRLEDVAQLSREVHNQVRVSKVVNFKPMWWLSAVFGQHNRFAGKVHAYEALMGCGGAVVSLAPAAAGIGDKEYDEEDVEVWKGDRNVLAGVAGGPGPGAGAAMSAGADSVDPGLDGPRVPMASVASDARSDAAAVDVDGDTAPVPVGPYPHARHVGDLLYLSGIGPRRPTTDEIPGGPVRDAAGQPLDYDVEAQTRSCLDNIATILQQAGSGLEDVIDVTVFLTDMERDFSTFNAVYGEYLGTVRPTRTTVEVRALPTPIAVELKVVAKPGHGARGA